MDSHTIVVNDVQHIGFHYPDPCLLNCVFKNPILRSATCRFAWEHALVFRNSAKLKVAQVVCADLSHNSKIITIKEVLRWRWKKENSHGNNIAEIYMNTVYIVSFCYWYSICAIPWWRHHSGKFRVTGPLWGESTASRRCWVEMAWRSLWRHCNAVFFS